MGTRILLLFVFAAGCFAQQWEIGMAGGYGIYRNASIIAPAGTATAGFRNRFALSFVAGQDLYKHISGEFRYTFHDGDPFLEAGGTKTNLQGVSHAFHYDVLFHFHGRDAKFRPYIAAGGGAKIFVVNGPENPSQPLQDIGLLTHTKQARALLTVGGGVKIRLGHNVAARIDFRDYITPFPKRIIAPVPFATARGILHQFTPLFGVSYIF